MRILTKKMLTADEASDLRMKLVAATAALHAAGPFDFPADLVGQSSWLGADGWPVKVWYDPATGAAGLFAARHILAKIDTLMAWNDAVFGVRGLGGNVIVCAVGQATDGNGGAYHYGCGFGANGGDWYVDVAGDPLLTFGLVEAEVSESYMGLQKKGWDCGNTSGEVLSRYLAEIVSGGPDGALAGFASGPSWDGADWLSKNQGTDTDYRSIGCGTVYLWLQTRQNFTPAQIVQAGCPDGTLASNFMGLTGLPASEAMPTLLAAIKSVGGLGGFQGDNPFHAPVPPYPPVIPPPPPPPPPLPPPAGPDLAAILQAVDARFASLEAGFGRLGRIYLRAANPEIDRAIRALYAPSRAATAESTTLDPVTSSSAWVTVNRLVHGLAHEFGPDAMPHVEAFVAGLNLNPALKEALEILAEGLMESLAKGGAG